MSFSAFVQQEVLRPRLERNGVLVVYDPDRRYRELCLGMANEALRVVDCSESSIESRAEAIGALSQLGGPGSAVEGLLIYVPARRPISDEECQLDPFALYSVCGGTFPEGDGDEYLSLCLKAKPDHATDIRRIFAEDPSPSFAVVDAVGGGLGWPNLRALLGAESSRDILFALLAPSEQREKALKGEETWVAEARDLFRTALGLRLKTRSKAWSTIAEELWRFLLFSEFVFDLPEGLPAALGDVPRAPDAARPLVEDLCERLRSDQRTRQLYIERAEIIEQDLGLPGLCSGISDLGVRDTFPFEERTYLDAAVKALGAGCSRIPSAST